MENQNQHYGAQESVYAEDTNNEKQFLHSDGEDKPTVTGDPSEAAGDRDLNSRTESAGIADTEGLKDKLNSLRTDPKENDDENGDPDDDDDPALDVDDLELDDDDLELDDDLIEKDLDTDDKHFDDEEEDFLK